MLPTICVDGSEKTSQKDGPVSGAAVAGLGRLLLRGLDSVTVPPASLLLVSFAMPLQEQVAIYDPTR